MKSVRYSHTARRSLRKNPEARRIMAKIERYAETGAGDVTRLAGEDRCRIRAGNYRVIFHETETEIEVENIGHRRLIYDQGDKR